MIESNFKTLEVNMSDLIKDEFHKNFKEQAEDKDGEQEHLIGD